MSLTDEDRRIIAQARELAALRGVAALRERTGAGLVIEAFASVLAEAQHLLPELVAIISRLDGEDEAPEAVIAAWCKRCRRGTRSIPCPSCGGPACANCGRCPDCDGEITEADHG